MIFQSTQTNDVLQMYYVVPQRHSLALYQSKMYSISDNQQSKVLSCSKNGAVFQLTLMKYYSELFMNNVDVHIFCTSFIISLHKEYIT